MTCLRGDEAAQCGAVTAPSLLGFKGQLNVIDRPAIVRRQETRKTQGLKADISRCVYKKILLGILGLHTGWVCKSFNGRKGRCPDRITCANEKTDFCRSC